MKRTILIVQWIPRILCILAILFIGMFSLDVFDPRLTIWQQIAGFLMHNIPAFVMIVFLVVAWKYELLGGIIIAALGIGFAPYLFRGNYHMNHSVWMSLGVVAMINLPFIITGGLFILSHYLKKKHPV